jgi:hypothetical protein
VIPKGLFSEGLLAWVITSKFNDALQALPKIHAR